MSSIMQIMTPDDQPPLIVPPRPGDNLSEWTVTELGNRLKRSLEDQFGRVRVRGEVSKVTWHRNGYLYLTLKDEKAVIETVCWKPASVCKTIRPEVGMEVVLTGKISAYPGRSQYQMLFDGLSLAGVGALLQMIEERRKRLAAEGLFDAARKKPIPFLPTVIGVITSPTGDVIHDILHRISGRFPRRVLLWPVAVQGAQAAAQVVAAIEGFNRLDGTGPVPRPDVLIVARGGGSPEDLMAFNEESVVRAVVASGIPIISGVGHEPDVTLIDHAADWRAPTPTAAAEKAVPVRLDLLALLQKESYRMDAALARMQADKALALRASVRGLADPQRLIEQAGDRLEGAARQLDVSARHRLQQSAARLATVSAAISPQMVRGQYRDGQRRLVDLIGREARAWGGMVRLHQAAFDRVAGRLSGQTLQARLTAGQGRVQDETARFVRVLRQSQTGRQDALVRLGQMLDSLSYTSVLKRGYAVVRDSGGKPVMQAAALSTPQSVSIEFADGVRHAEIVKSSF
jgi:exodeoxyribonuclease VII large subunit